MSLPERFDLSYIGQDNERHRPIMIHRVIYGSIERFFGILVEHFAGKFPLWLAPVQVILLPINDDLIPFAEEQASELERAGLLTEVDRRSESLKKKVRDAQLQQIPLILTCGAKEKEQGTVSVRTLDGKVRHGIALSEFKDQVLAHIAQRRLELDLFKA
jgi:threonyl-tRNA synthetase